MAAASQRGFEEDREPERLRCMSSDRPLTARVLTTAHRDPDDRIGMSVLHGLATAVLGAGLGVQIFLSFLVAPAAFRVVDRPLAARVMEGVFPGYYGFGLATTTMALLLVLALALRQPGPLRWGTVALLGLTLAGTVYAGHVLLPEAHAARLRAQAAPAGEPAAAAAREIVRQHRDLRRRSSRPGSAPCRYHRGPDGQARAKTHSSNLRGSYPEHTFQ